jgi:hypothetical protein
MKAVCQATSYLSWVQKLPSVDALPRLFAQPDVEQNLVHRIWHRYSKSCWDVCLLVLVAIEQHASAGAGDTSQ